MGRSIDLHSLHLPRTFGHALNVNTLPEAKEGDWGYVIRRDIVDDRNDVLYYDDDESVCICNASEDCDFDWEPYEHLNPYEASVCSCGTVDCTKYTRKHVPHMRDNQAVCYETDFAYGVTGHSFETMNYLLPHDMLAALPDDYEGIDVHVPSRRQGYLYMMASQPDLSLHRMKCGFTSDPPDRLKAYRTLCPRILLLALWEADKHHEQWFHEFLTRDDHGARMPWGLRYGTSEEFDLYDPFATMRAVNRALVEVLKYDDAAAKENHRDV